ncbi:Gfo/Idh/MocA family oxidoreductase [Silicimonas algicola]|uniref:Putative dehydrogenase n=1 Tax=Silicimonas algicola TaxID=1826607 RepID=A0A316GDH9_9RHOB|nr:Gfo/Idh/MocA family oxidoreductase [Silicimonas algicola]AZQ68319.1 Gfo/Idh/MocA family oxidoreductase [Silicimonas algicola]PWK52707.1 putative dehydrogenase [Silicimonas algicola]
MKVLFTGASHWHLPLFSAPLRRVEGARLVAVTDPDPARAREIAAREGCAWAATPEEAIAQDRPDLAFVLGRHADMAAAAHAMIDANIPFVIEKPAGLTLGEVEGLADAAAAKGLFAAVPFVIRSSGFMAAVRELLVDEPALYAGFRFNAGLPQRYRDAGCGWMLSRALSGGGVLTNLGVHFLDLMAEIFPDAAPEAASANFASLSGEGDIEDYAAATFHFGRGIGLVETGYLYPAPTGVFDLHFSVRTAGHYIAATGPGVIEITDLDGRQERRAATVTNMEEYPAFVAEVVRRVRDGLPPVAGLADMVRVMGMMNAAYRAGGIDRGQ